MGKLHACIIMFHNVSLAHNIHTDIQTICILMHMTCIRDLDSNVLESTEVCTGPVVVVAAVRLLNYARNRKESDESHRTVTMATELSCLSSCPLS